MTETSKIKLNYFNTIWREYQWFLIYEFQMTGADFFLRTDKEILKTLIETRVLGKSLYHPEMDEKEKEVAVKNFSRPYEFEKIGISDFKFLQFKADFEKWFIKFKTIDWKDDREDAKILIEKAEKVIWSRTNLKNGVWQLSKENFKEDSDKLDEIHWIYLHFETFIEIDRENKIIRTFDFGYD
ncbi:hypothetical protein ACE01N_20610 [Saccharicrinis sp. FJH2]|uniref:hypothetical protein n=1 Tax=Saccharicrinis sp. FJH65 TaxID=3344659 RepID=UPI0035F2D07B